MPTPTGTISDTLNYKGRGYELDVTGNPTGLTFSNIYAKEYFVVSAKAHYTFKLADRRRLELTLNVSNLLDYNDPVFSNTTTFRGVPYRNGYTSVDPRKAMLNATLHF